MIKERIENIQRILLTVKVEVSEAPKLIGIINELDELKQLVKEGESNG